MGEGCFLPLHTRLRIGYNATMKSKAGNRSPRGVSLFAAIALAAGSHGFASSTLPSGYTRLTYVSIPRPEARACNVFVTPVAWNAVRKVYVKYATEDAGPSYFMMLRAHDPNNPSSLAAPYLYQQANPKGGIAVADSGLAGVVPTFTEGDGYGRDGLAHELTVAVQASSAANVCFGAPWNDDVWNCTASWFAVRLYGADDSLLADVVPCRDPEGAAGFYDCVSGEALSRFDPSGAGTVAGPDWTDDYLTLTGHPEAHGTPEPRYGRVQPMAGSRTVTLCAPTAETNEVRGFIAYCTGWKMTLADGSETSGSELSHVVDFEQAGVTGSTFAWCFAYSNRVVVAAAGMGDGSVAVGAGPSTTVSTNYVAPGETISVRAAVGKGARFVRWIGTGFPSDKAKETAFSFTVNAPSVLRACFLGGGLPEGYRAVSSVTVPKVDEGEAPCQNPVVVEDVTWGLVRAGEFQFSTTDPEPANLMLFAAKDPAVPNEYPGLMLWLSYERADETSAWSWQGCQVYGFADDFALERPDKAYSRDGKRQTLAFRGTPQESFARLNPVFGSVYYHKSYAHTSAWYGVKLRDADGDFLCDARPCVRLCDDAAGFLNLVTGAFYTNTLKGGLASYPPFVAGPTPGGFMFIVK